MAVPCFEYFDESFHKAALSSAKLKSDAYQALLRELLCPFLNILNRSSGNFHRDCCYKPCAVV